MDGTVEIGPDAVGRENEDVAIVSSYQIGSNLFLYYSVSRKAKSESSKHDEGYVYTLRPSSTR